MRAAIVAVALILAGCATAPVPPPAATEPFVVDIGNVSLHCMFRGQVLRFLLIEGQEATQFKCVDPPNQPSKGA